LQHVPNALQSALFLTPKPLAGVEKPSNLPPEQMTMTRPFKVGDHVSWNSEAGRVRGRIIRVHTKDVDYKGYVHHASPDDPQYEIKSDKTDHIALHKGQALRHLRD
jgi:hypothetical protein